MKGLDRDDDRLNLKLWSCSKWAKAGLVKIKMHCIGDFCHSIQLHVANVPKAQYQVFFAKWIDRHELWSLKPQFASSMMHNASPKWLCSGNGRSHFHQEGKHSDLRSYVIVACNCTNTWTLAFLVLHLSYSSVLYALDYCYLLLLIIIGFIFWKVLSG